MDRIKIKSAMKSHSKPSRKPSIKITVSADVPEVFNNSPVQSPSPKSVIKTRVLTFSSAGEDKSMRIEGDNDDGDETFTTRISIDESVMDYPNCIDFGIKDFLCCKDEIDLELSSDTDTSFLEATPPHRFSDSELENQIEIMSITLDNALNLNPKRTNFSYPMSKDDLFTFDLIRFESQAQSRDVHYHSGNFNTQLQNFQAYKLEHRNVDAVPPRSANIMVSESINTGAADSNSNGDQNNRNRRSLPPPPRPFRRNISLPASIFMTYLMAEQMKTEEKNTPKKFPQQNDLFSMRSRKLTRIDGSYSSNESTDGDGSPNENDDAQSVHTSTENVDMSRSKGAFVDQGDSSSMSSSRDTPLYSQSQSGSEVGLYKCDLESIEAGDGDGMASGESAGGDYVNLRHGDDEQAFTSEIERKSLVIRYMRKLIRQDTSGNFAPPDYCI